MANRSKDASSLLIKVASILLAFYVIFLLGKSIWANYDLRSSIRKLNDQISTLQSQKKDLKNLNVYYSSSSYRELEARKNLGLKKPDEKVFIIPGSSTSTDNFQHKLSSDQSATKIKTYSENKPNWQYWLDFFTKTQE